MEVDILEELYRKYYQSALLYCTALCGDHATAEDLVEDAFIKAWKSFSLDQPSFQFWLFKVCKHLWIDKLRKKKYLLPYEDLDELSDRTTPEDRYLDDERNDALFQAISHLPPPDRELVMLHYFSDLPLHEIALIVNKNYAAVRQRMVRLRLQLRKELEGQGYGI